MTDTKEDRLLQEARACFRGGDLDRAELLLSGIPAASGQYADALFMTGIIRYRKGKAGEAEALLRQAIQLKPSCQAFYFELGVICFLEGHPIRAAQALLGLFERNPGATKAYPILAQALSQIKETPRALQFFELAVRAGVVSHEVFFTGAALADRAGNPEAAIKYYQKAIEAKPDWAAAWFNLGNVAARQVHPEEAIKAYEKALSIDPGFSKASKNLGVEISNLLIRLNYMDMDPEEIFQRHRFWGNRLETLFRGRPLSHRNPRDPDRTLKIGYMSRDFRMHSVSFFFSPILAGHDKSRFHVTCYCDGAVPDQVTESFRQQADGWCDILGMSHEQVAQRIRSDEIDILVDLAGHTGNNRLPVFARKPSPIQVSFIGYPNTTGMPSMDYRIVDAVTDPRGQADRRAVETLVRLPKVFLCYDPMERYGEPSPPDMDMPGQVLFGAFNTRSKIQPETVRVWSEILEALPRARILFKSGCYDDPQEQEQVREMFRRHRTASGRLVFSGWSESRRAHLEMYNQVHIALDTFPYNGTTTTCEALWMGVPVIALTGNSHVSRVSASLLNAAGLPELAAGSAAAYVKKAVDLARDPVLLTALRTGIHRKVVASDLMDAARYVGDLEDAYGRMWRQWCLGAEELNRQGEAMYAAGDFPGAVERFKSALAVNPEDTITLNNLGVACWQLNDIERAADCFRKVLEADPFHPDARHNLAVLKEMLGK